MSTTVIEPAAERLFQQFLDPVDGTACFSAESTPGEITAACRPLGLRFPLYLDPSASLSEHITAATHAPASCRFGPYCDNILGMNWRCPNGALIRVGEQVAKTTTGYDWLRFLLHSGTRFGRPVDYVVRLRPECGHTQAAILEGTPDTLESCLREFIHSGWMHWWDSVDFLTDNNRCQLRVLYHTVPEEVSIYAHRISEIAVGHKASVTSGTLNEGAWDGLPDLVLKTTPDRTVALSRKLARDGHRCVALWYSGVVHAYFKNTAAPAQQAAAIGTTLAHELEAEGGDWHSKHLPTPEPTPAEREWLEILQEVLDTP